MKHGCRATWILPFLLLLSPAPRGFGQELYWEDPRLLVPSGVHFPTALSSGRVVASVWQETVAVPGGGGRIYLSLAATEDGKTWRQTRRFAGPFEYREQDAPIFSAAVDRQGRIGIAVTGTRDTVQVLFSADQGRSFQPGGTLHSPAGEAPGARVEVLAAPQLFVTSTGSWLLCVTQERGGYLATYYALSADGQGWSELSPLASVNVAELAISLLPYHAPFQGQDYVVFQAARAGDTTTKTVFQLYLKASSDGGRTWGPETPLELARKPDTSNQRPNLVALDDRLALAWESKAGIQPVRINYVEIDGLGRPLTEPAVLRGGDSAWDNIDKHDSRVFEFRGRVYLTGSDGNDQVFSAERRGTRWNVRRPRMGGASRFIQPVRQGDRLYLFWENRQGALSGLALQEPDRSVNPPNLTGVNFDPRTATRQKSARIRWGEPYDPSFIAGYRYAWSQDPNAPLDNVLNHSQPTQELTLDAPQDGVWHFLLAAEDNARNLSLPASIRFERDTVPPDPVTVIPPGLDAAGFVRSNTFRIAWAPAGGQAIAGYAYTLRPLRDNPRAEPGAAGRIPVPAPAGLTGHTSVSYTNLDNGLWAFSIIAVDPAGNVSAPSTLFLRLNRYVARTLIGDVEPVNDLLGRLTGLRIEGRNFSTGGRVTEVFLDRDGRAPYDHVFRLADGGFRIPNDRLIDGIRFSDLQEGSYRVGVIHPVRGVVMTEPRIRSDRTGTVKFGDYSGRYRPSWTRSGVSRPPVRFDEILVWLIVGMLGLAALVTARKVLALARESRRIRTEMFAILNGRGARKELRMREIRRRGVGLRFKFTFLTVLLVVLIVAMVSVPLYFYMRRNQTEKSAVSLYEKASVMLGSISASATSGLGLPEETPIERLDKQSALSVAAGQISAMAEAESVTISGSRAASPEQFDFVWTSRYRSSGDRSLEDGLDSGEKYAAGETRLEDEGARSWIPVAGEGSADQPWAEYSPDNPFAGTVADLAAQITRRTDGRIATSLEERKRIQQQALRLDPNDPQYTEKNAALSRQNSLLRTRIDEEIRRVGQVIGVQPLYPYLSRTGGGELQDRYTFFMPIVYLRGEGRYFQGMVRLGVSTVRIKGQIAESTRQILATIGIVALAAALMGLIGALIMSAITVNPIRKLARGVAVIRDTEDKEKLKDHVIEVGTRDEIGELAETVNEMTRGLVKAAVSTKEMIFGKEVQKRFLPLEADSSGEKGNTASLENRLVEIYGYYKGAAEVSGDYFDYLKLDDRHIAFIKCDVSGHGVPAALIMVEVATIFAGYFRGWTLNSPGLRLDTLVYRINDMVEERGFKGRFAALNIGILDTKTGEGHFCHAGDKLLRVYSQSSGKVLTVEMPESPAAGAIATFMVEMKGGYKPFEYRLAPGDTLLLYTDGIEEANRPLRDAQFRVESEDQVESFGNERIAEITSAVFGRRQYRLRRERTPVAGEELVFDFSSCQGSVKEAVLALMAVEKVFRLVPDPAARDGDRVVVDSPIDGFLRACFRQYAAYFAHPLENPDPAVRVFSRLKEDTQDDDLTILAIRRK